jgi:hypothetical protein
VREPGPTELGGYDLEALPDSFSEPDVDPDPEIAEAPSWPPRGWLLDGAGDLHKIEEANAPPPHLHDVRRDAMHELTNPAIWSLTGFLVGFVAGALTARFTRGGRRVRQ